VLALQTAGTTAVTVDASQNVTLAGTLTTTGVTTFQAGTAALPSITTTGDTNTGIFFPAADTIAFSEGGAEAVRIDSSGNVGIGTTTSTNRQTLQFSNTATTANSESGLSIYNSARGNNYQATVKFGSYESNNSTRWTAAEIGAAFTAYTDGANSGALLFSTSNAGTVAERARIDSSGNLGIGTTSPSTSNTAGASFVPGTSTVASMTGSNGSGQLLLGNNGNGSNLATNDSCGMIAFKGRFNSTFGGGNDIASIIGTYTGNGTTRSGAIRFLTLNLGTEAEAARIDSSGNLLVGATSAGAGTARVYIDGDGTNPAFRASADTTTTSVYAGVFRHESTTAGAYIQFVTDNNVETGRIFDSGGNMQYGTSSDARLKTNVQPMQNSLQYVLALNPCTFDMRRGKDTFISSSGLIAQEVHEVYPFVVGVGGDDENTNPWSVDYGKLTPLLVAAIKEQQALITQLQADVAALKGASA